MRVQNHTTYRTRDLSAFFRAGLKAAGASSDKTIRVVYSRSSGMGPQLRIGGHASYSDGGREGRQIQIALPNREEVVVVGKNGQNRLVLGDQFAALPADYLLVLAQVFDHEVSHTLGLTHGEMVDWWKTSPTWHAGLQVRRKEAKKPAEAADKPTAAERREAAGRRHLARTERETAELERSLERKRGLLRKWNEKVRYYERKKGRS